MITSHEQERFDAYWQSLHQDGTLMFAGKLLERAAKLWPERIAYLCGDETITYQELFRRACLVTNNLRSLGVGPDDNVILWYENSIEFFIAYYGIWQTGAVVAALNVFLHPKEFEYIMQDAKPKAVIISDMFYTKLDDAIKARLPGRIDQSFLQNGSAILGVDYCDIAIKDPNALAVLLYTSGTTGTPKGVMLSSRNLLMNAIQNLLFLPGSECDRFYMPLPLFHSFAQNTAVWRTVFTGASCIIVPKIDKKSLLEGLALEPTVVLGVPALYGLFCLIKTAPFDNVRHFICGSDVLQDKIRAGFALLYGRNICNGYGLTEAAPIIAAHMVDEHVSAETVGVPVFGIQCEIRLDGKQVPPGEKGVLWVKGDNVMLGYYNAPELNNAVFKDGWLNTGDFARFDAQGRLQIVGREKDIIIHKGFNIYPAEIERVLLSHPEVSMAAVIGAIENGEEVPVAFVVLKNPFKDLEKELRSWCADQLATYKIPRTFKVKSSLPFTAMSKIDKKQLKAELSVGR